jgi:hypothetical protein
MRDGYWLVTAIGKLLDRSTRDDPGVDIEAAQTKGTQLHCNI